MCVVVEGRRGGGRWVWVVWEWGGVGCGVVGGEGGRCFQSANDTTCSSAPESMIRINRFPDSSDGRSELSQTVKTSNGIPEMSQTDSAHTC